MRNNVIHYIIKEILKMPEKKGGVLLNTDNFKKKSSRVELKKDSLVIDGNVIFHSAFISKKDIENNIGNILDSVILDYLDENKPLQPSSPEKVNQAKKNIQKHLLDSLDKEKSQKTNECYVRMRSKILKLLAPNSHEQLSAKKMAEDIKKEMDELNEVDLNDYYLDAKIMVWQKFLSRNGVVIKLPNLFMKSDDKEKKLALSILDNLVDSANRYNIPISFIFESIYFYKIVKSGKNISLPELMPKLFLSEVEFDLIFFSLLRMKEEDFNQEFKNISEFNDFDSINELQIAEYLSKYRDTIIGLGSKFIKIFQLLSSKKIDDVKMYLETYRNIDEYKEFKLDDLLFVLELLEFKSTIVNDKYAMESNSKVFYQMNDSEEKQSFLYYRSLSYEDLLKENVVDHKISIVSKVIIEKELELSENKKLLETEEFIKLIEVYSKYNEEELNDVLFYSKNTEDDIKKIKRKIVLFFYQNRNVIITNPHLFFEYSFNIFYARNKYLNLSYKNIDRFKLDMNNKTVLFKKALEFIDYISTSIQRKI